MNDLKLQVRTEKATEKATVYMISRDICMEFRIEKCGLISLKRVKVSKNHAAHLESGEII